MSAPIWRAARPLWFVLLFLIALVALQSASQSTRVAAQEASPNGYVPRVAVAGKVVNPDGTPAANVPVALLYCQVDLCFPGTTAFSDADGNYEVMTSMTMGEVRYISFGDDETYFRAYWDKQRVLFDASQISLDYDNLPLNMPDATVFAVTGATKSTISGVVRAGDTPVAGIEARIFEYTGINLYFRQWTDTGVSATTGADGNYSVEMPLGNYHVAFSDPTGAYADNPADFLRFWAFPGYEFVADGSMIKAATISGRVRNVQGQAIADVEVEAECLGCAAPRVRAVTDAEGNYKIRGVRKGNWTVTALASGGYISTVHGTNGEATPVPVTNSATVEEINIVMPLGASIKGRVVSNRGGPLANLRVCIADENGYCSNTNTRTDSQGNYELTRLEAGEVTLVFGTFSIDHRQRYYHNQDDFASATPVKLEAGKESLLLEQTLIRLASISGRVIDLAGNPIAGSANLLRCDEPESCSFDGAARLDATGRYLLTAIEPGTYVVRVQDEDLLFVEAYYDNAQVREDATPIVITEDEAVSNINFTLLREDGTIPEVTGEELAPGSAFSMEGEMPEGRSLHISAPAGAVTESVRLHAKQLHSYNFPLPADMKFGNIAFAVFATQGSELAEPLNLEKPLRFTIGYRDYDVDGLSEESLTLLYFDVATRTWKSDGITIIEHLPEQNKLVAEVTHLTDFGLFEEATPEVTSYSIWLPRISK